MKIGPAFSNLDILIAVPGLPFSGKTFDSQSLGGCVVGSTLIDIPRDLKANPGGIPITDVCERITSGEDVRVYSFDTSLQRVVLRKVTKAWRTKRRAEVWNLIYTWVTRNGEERKGILRATPDHRIMLRDGTYRALSELQPDDSLMPFNRFQGPNKNAKYFRIDLNNGDWCHEHQFIPKELGWEYTPKTSFGYNEGFGDVVHHKNFRWYDNSVTNLQPMDWLSHLRLHQGSNKSFREWYDNLTTEEYAEFCEKQRLLSLCKTPEGKRRSIRALREGYEQWKAVPGNLAACAEKISASNKISWNTDPRLKQISSDNGKKIGGRNKGTTHSEATKQKMRDAWAETREQRCAATQAYWDRLSPEQKRDRVASFAHSPWTDERRERNGKSQLEFLAQLSPEQRKKRFLPLVTAAKEYRLSHSNHTVVSVSRCKIREDVYDLEVEGTHNFAANGIIIHNSETSGYYLAKALAKRGHRVTVFCSISERDHCEDVDYLPIGMFQQYAAFSQHDVCIVQRLPDLFPANCRARFSALWCHDLAMGRSSDTIHGTAWNYDKVFVLSEFMRSQYKSVYDLPDDLMVLTRNGVDLECVKGVHDRLPADVKRNPLSLVYSARPERGLDVLLAEIIPRILKYEPQAKLFLSAYDNKVPDLAEFYAQCDSLAARLGDRVEKLGALTKTQLYELYHAAGVYVYPTPSLYAPDFDEISCISFMEAMACGLPVVSSVRGALPETLAPEAGRLIAEPIHTTAYYDAFAEATVRLMRDPNAWRTASSAGLAHAATLSWDGVAEQWEQVFAEGIQAKSSDLATLANHFWHRSDIYAARECLKQLPEDDAKSLAVRQRVAKDWAFLDEPDGFRQQYERIGSTHDAAVIDWAPQEPRYAAVRVWLKKKIEEKHQAQTSTLASGERYSSGDREYSVLDYGCAHGAYATNLLKEIPDLRITGVDIDQHGIEMAYGFAEKLGVSDRWRGVVGGIERLGDENVPEMTEQYDAVLAQEVIEHVEDPGATLSALEARVKDGGFVYITVPFGPWEYSDYRRYPFRAHLWEFDLHDLYDLLENVKGKEADVHIYALSYGQSPETDDSLGWWVVQYKVTPETRGKTGAIDWERKLTLQRPRQTVSAAIIAGPNCEETLHWCLRSLVHVVDELVIANCGLSAEALRVIDTYRWGELTTEKMRFGPQHYFLDIKLIPGVDPKVHGFETPRNMALEHCTQDWILWLDTDEKLLQPQFTTKYLRANSYQGYSIRQHHFAVDTHFDPDLPVRLFRNNGKLHWLGQVHEHPEEGLNKGPGRTIVVADLHIPHVGYLIESGRQARFTRNLPMLEADIRKYPDRKLQKHFIMRDHMLLSTYELQNNGGRVTPEIRGRATEVIRLYREHFLGQGFFSNVDPITYYSQAVTLLGEGFDALIQISADKIDAKPNGALKARFANMEDYMTEVTRRARASAERFENRYY